ncbi:hypothetical protein [Spiroplasma endosymbiont of Lonchoptera lutea]|uniref:hypothetical protein n=1 Tax=Spiroplasma endosymbiont of Lonchoptera lutea TaxID=3066297 RepID=UPI0030D2C95A
MKKSFISFLATLTLTPMTLMTVMPTVSCSLKSIDARIWIGYNKLDHNYIDFKIIKKEGI